MVASSSGSSATSGSGRSGSRCQSLTSPITSSSLTTCGCADVFGLAADVDALQRRDSCADVRHSRSSRSRSTMATLAPESIRPYSQLRPGPPGIERRDDGAGEQAPKKADRPFRQVAHDDRDAVALAHARAPAARRRWRARRARTPRRSRARRVDEELALAVRRGRAEKASRKVGGAFFQTRVRTPRMVRSSISNGEPGGSAQHGPRRARRRGMPSRRPFRSPWYPPAPGTASAERQ